MQLAPNEKQAKSGNTLCPALMGADGQSRAKPQITSGEVCNESGPAPKGKRDSELRRDTESGAETTPPTGVIQ